MPNRIDANISSVTDKAKHIQNVIVQEISNNSLEAYLIAVGIAVGGALLVFFLRDLLTKWAKKRLERFETDGTLDTGLTVKTINEGIFLLGLWPIYIGYSILRFSQTIEHMLDVLFLIIFTIYIIKFFNNLFMLIIDTSFRRHNKKNGSSKSTGKTLTPIVHSIVWAIGLTFLLDNLGFQVSSIIAGLGIMGVAVGLAGQAILADFFSYLVILLDQPFTVGDRITMDSVTGIVEKVGIKTTRIKSDGGALIIIPNNQLTKSNVYKFTPPRKLSKLLSIAVAYETPIEKLKAIPSIISEEANRLTIALGSVHLTKFGDYGLNFDISIYTTTYEQEAISLLQDKISFAIIERFAKENIALTYAGMFKQKISQ